MRRNRKHNPNIFYKSKTKSKKKTQKKESKGILKSIIYSLSICLFVVLIACLGIGAGMYAAIVNEMNEMNVQELALTRSSIVYYTDADGNSHEAETLFSDGNCIWIDSNEIPGVMKDAIVSIEDERFYKHSGVDIKRTAGAVLGYVKERLGMGIATYGGSTITQQVIKNITQEKDRTPIRKVKEMMRAVAIEKQLSKDEILTVYLNVIFLANNCYGIEAASNTYFNKPAAELTLTESALIAGITQRPSYYDPLRNPENAITKRNTVLSKMYELGKITKEEYDEAVASDLGLNETHANSNRNIYSYFIDTVVNDVIRDLQSQKGYTESFATQQVFSGGLKIYSTMDINIQNAMEEVFENSSNFGGSSKAQGAMVIIDPTNGQIKGIVGGTGEKVDARGWNRATQTIRQPGSSLKPLSVYTPAIEKRLITQSTRIVDEPITIKDWKPKNSYTGYKGSMTIKKAVEISANIPAIKVLQEVGLSTSYNYLINKFHLSTIDSADKDYSPLALGGLTNGVTIKEMAAAYSVFANEGQYTEPHTYTKVLDSSNRVLLENTPKSKEVISPATAYTMGEMLYSVVNGSSGTGKTAKLSNVPTYGKTGTSNNNYDKWFVGYTPYYVGAVWCGFDRQESITDAGISSSIAPRTWKKVMEKVHDGMEGEKISAGEDVVKVYVCSKTGELANSNCNSVAEYFIKGQEPDVYCSQSHVTSTPTPTTPTDEEISSPEDTTNSDGENTTGGSEGNTDEPFIDLTTPEPAENESISRPPANE